MLLKIMQSRNYDLSLATHSWILFLDADERLTADLKEEIIKTIHHKDSFLPIIVTATSCSKHETIR
jgi:glycosyltransferase involved in cell wall biosynthesis